MKEMVLDIGRNVEPLMGWFLGIPGERSNPKSRASAVHLTMADSYRVAEGHSLKLTFLRSQFEHR